MYTKLSKYPPIKRDLTIETPKGVGFDVIERIVTQPDWNTEMERIVKLKDIYQKWSVKRTTFSLTVTRHDRQPEVNDVDFWIHRISEQLDGVGFIPDHKPKYTLEEHSGVTS